MNRLPLLACGLFILLAGCSSADLSTGASADAGVLVSCDDTTIEQFSTDVSPGSDEPDCDVNIEVRYLNTDDYICRQYTSLYSDGNSVAGCPGLAAINETIQLRVEATFYEHRTTNRIGQDAETLYWRD